MDAQILPASKAEGHRPPVHPEGRRVTSHESPVAPRKLFEITLLSKNASASHLESHSCKNTGLKVPCFHTLTKNIGGEGVPHLCFQSRTSNLEPPPLSRVTSHESQVTSPKSFNICTYVKTSS